MESVFERSNMNIFSTEFALKLDKQYGTLQYKFNIPLKKDLPNSMFLFKFKFNLLLNIKIFVLLLADHTLIKDDEPCVYMNGNSLGLEPKITKTYVLAELEKWSKM